MQQQVQEYIVLDDVKCQLDKTAISTDSQLKAFDVTRIGDFKLLQHHSSPLHASYFVFFASSPL